MEIEINNIELIEEFDTYQAMIFGDKNGTNYFQIQDSFEYDDQDVKLGMATYYIERDDQSFGTYGGIESIELNESTLMIKLSPVGIKRLKINQITIMFDKIQFDTIEKALKPFILKHCRENS